MSITSSVEKRQDSSDEETGNPFATDSNENGNPFEDEPGSPKISVPVRALYDYEGQEQDELSFKAGTNALEEERPENSNCTFFTDHHCVCSRLASGSNNTQC